ncbi:hypothetical protein CIG75_19285 [Tumebacillus algifaecis]|uniref:Tyr recombinase domain-containing protein n=1 Tax=Tumebacillus algifaecis TaxID=1214604 RepID=A0A223D5K8_9BACL|nr:site-specific integrase [Tumebacillus algifaecis]ASS76878.1 hypothetical protein CIG75_19285 [Tumebacillus algifaecis]
MAAKGKGRRSKGTGSVFEEKVRGVKTGNYVVKFNLGPRDPITGKRPQKEISHLVDEEGNWVDEKGARVDKSRRVKITTQKQANKILRDMLRRVDQGDLAPPSIGGDVTVDQVFDLYLEQYVRLFLEADTYKSQKSCLVPVRKEFGHMIAKELQPIQFQQFLTKCLKAGKAKSTVKRHYDVAKSAFEAAKRWRLIKENPLDDVIAPRLEEGEARFLTREEFDAIISEIKRSRSSHLAEMFILGCVMGMRRGELCGLKWEDVDLERRVLTVRRAIKRGYDKTWEEGPTKTKKSRTLHYGDLVADILDNQVKRQKKERFQAGAAYNGLGYVFAKPLGDHNNPGGLTKFMQRVTTRCNLEGVTIHTLRHTFASWLIEGGVNLFKIKEALGHSSLNMTARYSHVYPNDTEVSTKMDAAVTTALKKHII